jgi:structure-specific recognition protein 1
VFFHGFLSDLTHSIVKKRPKLKQTNPDLSFSELNKKIGEKYKELTAEQRQKYEALAAAAKEKYSTEMSAYKKGKPQQPKDDGSDDDDDDDSD